MKKILIIFVIIFIIFGSYYFIKDKPKAAKINQQEISLNKINNDIKNGSLLIDVRTPEEYEPEHAVGAINLPLDKIQSGQLPSVEKDKAIYVYCHSGSRASQAKAIFEKSGYSQVINLINLNKWVSLGGQVTGANSN